MRYAKKQVAIPEGMRLGSRILIAGEGNDEFYVARIDRDEHGDITYISTTAGCSEPLCKLCLWPEGQDFWEATQNESNWVQVAVGECLRCGKTFPDSCAYHAEGDDMVCLDCHNKKEDRAEKVFQITTSLIALVSIVLLCSLVCLWYASH